MCMCARASVSGSLQWKNTQMGTRTCSPSQRPAAVGRPGFDFLCLALWARDSLLPWEPETKCLVFHRISSWANCVWGMLMGSERHPVLCTSLEGGCLSPSARQWETRNMVGWRTIALWEKIRQPWSVLLVWQETEVSLEEGGAHERVLLTVNSRKLMLIYSSYTPCNLLEK